MTSTDPTSSTEQQLRQRAEDAARAYAAGAAEHAQGLSPDAMLKLIHELRVYQIELEMQNDELRRAQAALDIAQARYFDFYDLAPVGYLTVSEQGLILHANLTTATLLGVARSALPSQAISRYIDPQDQDTFFLLCQQLADSGTAQSRELQMVKHDGSRFSARLDAIAARGEDGAALLRMVLIDITAAKEATSHRLAMDQDILNSINAEIVVLDQHGIIRLVNEPWQRFALDNSATPGTPARHTGIGTDYLAACQSDPKDPLNSAETAHDGIRAVLSGVLPSFTLEYPCHSSHQQRWFSMRVLPLGKGPKDGITITHTDITAYKLAQDALSVAAAAFDISQAIVVMDSQRQILRVNQAYTQITGYSELDAVGQTTAALWSTQPSPSSYEDIWRDTLRLGVRRWESWLQPKKGQDFFAHGMATAVKNTEGDTTHYVITFSDHTATHQQEQQRVLHEATQREALVREVHHRIKNNLQGIGGLLQQFGSQKPEIAEQMQLVAGHLNGISIIYGLQGRHHDAKVRLCELTREIAQANSALWQTDIAVDIPANWTFRIVAEKEAVSLALVLNELMVNAIKHGGRAHGHVSVTLRQGPGLEGVELNIVNAGYLRNNQDRPSQQHHGLQLVESLSPREGLKVTLTQQADQVQTLLQVTAPVIGLETPRTP